MTTETVTALEQQATGLERKIATLSRGRATRWANWRARSADQIAAWFEVRTEPLPNGCRLWMGARNQKGYGRLRVNGQRVLAHRLAFELKHGSIPPLSDGEPQPLDHYRFTGNPATSTCIGPGCVEADHLRPATVRENTMRSEVAPSALNGRKTHCPAGHPYTSENTYTRKTGDRQCRACIQARWQRRP